MPDTTGTPSSTSGAAFCGAEEQISDHTCNSLHPAVSIDPYGTAGIAWHDTRNGTFDIYFKTDNHPIPRESILLGLTGTTDPVTGRSINLSCSGFSAYSLLSAACDAGSVGVAGDNFVARHSGGMLDVNVNARVAILSGTRGEDFSAEGVQAGSQVKIETGGNAGDVFYVSRLVTNSIMELVYYDGIVSDTGFVYTIESNPQAQPACEARLTCGGMTNTYPDVQTDGAGRFHVVWQGGNGGDDQIYYVQIFPQDVGELKCTANRSITIGMGQDIPNNPGVLFDALTGKSSKAFSYGPSSMPDPDTIKGGSVLSRSGFHRIFRDFPTDGRWAGVSDVEDRDLWNDQSSLVGSSVQPTYVVPANHPIASEGDFGSKFDFAGLAFLVETPSEGKADITKVILPIKPRCTPSSIPLLNAMREQDVIAAPKIAVPLTFTDPVDLSQIQGAITDSLPPRFTIEGDTTVYTNVLVNAAGGLSRLIFKKKPAKGNAIKFVLGQRLCGDDECGVAIPTDGSNSDDSLTQTQYKVRLDAYLGPLVNSSDIGSASMTATRVFSDDFMFSPGEDRRTFFIDSGRLTVDAGHYLFFVAVTDDDYFVDAVGGGNVVWSVAAPGPGNVAFDQYFSPFTVPPNAGLAASVYYEGRVTLDPTAGTCDAPIKGSFEILGANGTPNAFVSVATSVADRVEVVSQELDLCRDAIVTSVELPIAAPTSDVASLEGRITSIDGLVTYSSAIVQISGVPPSQPYSVTFDFQNSTPLAAGRYLFAVKATPSGTDASEVNIPVNTAPGASPDGIENTIKTVTSISSGNIVSALNPGVIALAVSCFVAPVGTPLVPGNGGAAGGVGTAPSNALMVGATIKLTTDGGKHPRLAKDRNDNLWLVFHSDRTGNDEVYVTKFFADCGQWASSTQGGNEYQLSNAGSHGKTANFPSCVCDGHDEVCIAWQSTDTDDSHSEIFFSKSVGGGVAFKDQIRLTSSPGDALMPDVSASLPAVGNERIVVAWHDSRFGAYEIMAGMLAGGVWLSSGQGKFDIRITAAPGDSMFPRGQGDTKGNVRLVWQDYRRSIDNPGIYMATYVGANNTWECSGQGGSDALVSVTGTRSSLFPDVSTDPGNGVFVVWQDDRLALTNPDQHEEIFGSYCSRQDAVLVHYAPLTFVNTEGVVLTKPSIVSCVTGETVEFVADQNICLKIVAAGATYYRVANEDGSYSQWMPFVPTGSLDTTIVPWTLSPGNGTKSVKVQVQTDTLIGFPTTTNVVFHAETPTFTIRMFSDATMSALLPVKEGVPVTTSRDVYVRLATGVPLKDFPTFDIVSRGRAVRNQRMSLTSGVSGFSGIDPTVGASDFKGAFKINKDDGLFYVDGPARIVPHGVDIYGNEF